MPSRRRNSFSPTLALLLFAFSPLVAQEKTDSGNTPPIQISGVYPHLTMWNDEGECGTGAVVPWRGHLWAITYSPHRPGGSSDRLYEITPELEQRPFAGSVGGTPANRMIHRETNQLLIGPYLVDGDRSIRVIPPAKMFGRLTANARHLTDPARKIYYATMEEGLYEVDLGSLEVTCLIRDGNGGAPEEGLVSQLPGYHGKGLYSGQGRVVYANNGERHPDIARDPTIASGALAQWFGEGDWRLVRRNQFTEVTGPGGIHGNPDPATDPIWAMGWDARSLLLALLENGEWHYYRLPKGSHSYDGSHGWNTEWPRIREIDEGNDFLATMHGTFWKFPATFSTGNSAGIAPRSNYLKVIGDFCRWGDRLVLGCDDSAKAEFLNTRPFKAKHGAPLESNSNLWFVEPERLDHLGPPIGRGSVWLRDAVEAGDTSDPYLFSGYDFRQLHLVHESPEPVTFALEVDRDGTDTWTPLRELTVPAGEAVSTLFSAEESGAWVRLVAKDAAPAVTANFQYRDRDGRSARNDELFAGIATLDQAAKSYGLMRSLAHDRLGLVAATQPDGSDAGYYELNQAMELVPVDDEAAARRLVADVSQPEQAYLVDEASVVIIEDGRRYRLPKNDRYPAEPPAPTAEGKPLTAFLPDHLARGAAVTVSSTHDGYAAGNVVDGVYTDESRWIGGEDGEANWIELDLGEAKTFRNLWVVSGWDRRPHTVAANFDVLARTDAESEWELVSGGEIRNNTAFERELNFEEPVSARFLRISAKSPGFFRLYEIAPFAERPDVVETAAARFDLARVCREVATERDLLNIHGTFYELPARNAQGLAKARPVATHDLAIHDFCSHNGLLLFTGVDPAAADNEHLFRSADGKAAVWAGVVDDLWKLGKPRGRGGPWADTEVEPETPSDPYLMTAYDEKTVTLRADRATTIRLEVDIDGTGLWIPYRGFELEPGQPVEHRFPEGFSAYWVRAVSTRPTTATVQFVYE